MKGKTLGYLFLFEVGKNREGWNRETHLHVH
jgi:hypothetical protein